MGDRLMGAPALHQPPSHQQSSHQAGHHQQTQSAGAPLMPTWKGFVGSTMDALILFEACLAGGLAHVPRRPHDRERSQLIASGNVFIYEEHSSGIKRWTDGVPWSPSRILGNFLLYRELDKPFQPGEKKRAMKKTKENGVSKSTTPQQRSSSVGYAGMMAAGVYPGYSDSTPTGRDNERMLVGSLIDSYQFRNDGLIKKTISVNFNNVSHHLVSYYNVDEAKSGKLREVRDDPRLRDVTPRSALISAGNFRAPVDDVEVLVADRMFVGHPGAPIPVGEYLSRSMSVPSVHAYPGSSHWAPNPYMSPAPSYPHMSTPVPHATFPPTTTPTYAYDMGHRAPLIPSPQGYHHMPHRRVSLSAESPSTIGLYGANSTMGRNTQSGGHASMLMSNGHGGPNGIGSDGIHHAGLYEAAQVHHSASRPGSTSDGTIQGQPHAVYSHNSAQQNATSLNGDIASSFGSGVSNHPEFKTEFDTTVRPEAVGGGFGPAANEFSDELSDAGWGTFARH